jgi:amidase
VKNQLQFLPSSASGGIVILAALGRRNAYSEALGKVPRRLGCLDLPVTSGPAFTHRKIGKPIEVDGKSVPYWVANLSYTSFFNLTGNPVVVLPLTHSVEGLPIGVQVVGKRWRDMELLATAEKLTGVTGSFVRPKGY